MNLLEIYPKGNHRFFGKKIEMSFTFELKAEEVAELSAERMGQTFDFHKALN